MIITIRDVERAVCLRFQLTRDQLLRRDSSRAIANPRQIAMYLARELTGASFPRLGQHFARDHTSVLYACRMTAKRMAKDQRLASEVEGCREILGRSGCWKENVARAVKDHGVTEVAG
jgi:chromosomal replication initiator protein